MYITFKSVTDVQLDILETLMYSVSDNDKNKKAIVERVKSLREEFINGGSSAELDCKIRNFTVNLAFYISGYKVDVLEELAPLPKFRRNTDNAQNSSQNEQIQEISQLLSTAIQQIDSMEDSTQKRSALFAFEQTYMEISRLNSQEIEQLFSKIKYELMKEFLLKGEIDKARVLTHSFNHDMRFFITRRLSSQREALVSQCRYKEAYEILDYISSEKIDISSPNAPERSLSFWEKIIQIENPELHFRLPKLMVRKPKAGIFKGAWTVVVGWLNRNGKGNTQEDTIQKKDQIIDTSSEQGKSLISILKAIEVIRQKLIYLEMGIDIIDPNNQDKKRNGNIPK